MESLLQYKCPCCGGNIEFDSSVQRPKCQYCDTEFNVADLAAYDSELKSAKADSINWQTSNEKWAEDEAADGMKVYICNTCGGEIITKETTAAMKCPWCDNPIIIKGSVAGSLRPDYVIPFVYDKEAAKEGFRRHLKGKRFLPKAFSDEAHLDEIKGIYVPFWLFDAEADATFRYKARQSRSWREGDYEVTETKHFTLVRHGTLGFDNIPIDGSRTLPNDITESLEPFKWSELTDFRTAYLSGYLADKYDMTIEDTSHRVNARIKASVSAKLAATTSGYTGVSEQGGYVNVDRGRVSYALLPVWLLNTTWQDQKYVFAMNGQTGKFVGNLPTDKAARMKFFWTRFAFWTAAAMLGLASIVIPSLFL